MMDATVSVDLIRKRIMDARAVGDSDWEQATLQAFVKLGEQLERALQRYGDMIAEAATYNNTKRLRELHEGLHALRMAIVEWRLVAHELGVFTANANGSAHSGGGCCSPCAPAASFEEVAGDA